MLHHASDRGSVVSATDGRLWCRQSLPMERDPQAVADNLQGARFVALFVLLLFLGGFIASFTPIFPLVQAALGP
jgi:hypothetical protein